MLAKNTGTELVLGAFETKRNNRSLPEYYIMLLYLDQK